MLGGGGGGDRKADDNEARLDKGVEGVVRADCWGQHQ